MHPRYNLKSGVHNYRTTTNDLTLPALKRRYSSRAGRQVEADTVKGAALSHKRVAEVLR